MILKAWERSKAAMSESRRLILIVTFSAVDAMIIPDFGKLISEAEERAQAARIAEEATAKPAPAPPIRRTVYRLGGLASGFFA